MLFFIITNALAFEYTVSWRRISRFSSEEFLRLETHRHHVERRIRSHGRKDAG